MGVGVVSQPLRPTIQRVASAGVAGAARVAESSVGILGILFERTVGEPLLVAQLHATEVQDGILHAQSLADLGRSFHAGRSSEDSGNKVDAGTGIADLGAGHQGTLSISPVVDAAPPVHCATFS